MGKQQVKITLKKHNNTADKTSIPFMNSYNTELSGSDCASAAAQQYCITTSFCLNVPSFPNG
jgi:hypothetical protein